MRRVLVFTAVIALGTGLLFGLVPALQFSRLDLAVELKDRTSQPTRHAQPCERAQRARDRAGGVVVRRPDRRRAVPAQPAERASDRPGIRCEQGRGAVVQSHGARASPMARRRGSAGADSGAGARHRRRRTRGVLDQRAARRRRLRAQRVSRRAGSSAIRAPRGWCRSAQVGDGYFETIGIPLLSGRGIHGADLAQAPHGRDHQRDHGAAAVAE